MKWERIKCLFGNHQFTKSLIRCNNLEVKECAHCQTHLNIHYGMEEAYISRKHSLFKELEQMKSLFERLDSNEQPSVAEAEK